MDDDTFNSSDLDFEAPANPYANAGVKSMQAIIDMSVEDRISSKKTVKTLRLVAANPKTDYINALWYNRFMQFQTHTLKQSTTATPKGQDILRFLDSIISKIIPRVNEVPSASWFQGGTRRLLSILPFYSPGFKLSRHEGSRLKAFFNQLMQEGRLTRAPIHETQWIGAVLLQRIMVALFRRALEEGTTNWDRVLQKVLSLLLLGALACRLGDITKHNKDTHDLPFLCYKDITIKLVGGTRIEHLVALIVIRNEKAKKLNPRKNRKVSINAISGAERNIMCPIKLLLASAMRLGALEGPIERVLSAAAARSDKTIRWIPGKERNPVLCAFSPAGTMVMADKAALTDQVRYTIYNAGLHAGLYKKIVPHDVRYGSAKDTAYLAPIQGNGLTTAHVAAALGHSNNALRSGITAHYVDQRSENDWERRVDTQYKDVFDNAVTQEVYKKPMWTRVKLGQMYKDAGTETSNSTAKKRLREQKLKEHEKAWMSRSGSVLQPASTNRIIGSGKRKAMVDDSNEGPPNKMIHSPSRPVPDDSEGGGMDSVDSSLFMPSIGEDGDLTSRIDPRLLNTTDSLQGAIAGDGNKDHIETSTEIQEMFLNQLGTELGIPSALQLPDLEYIKFLSRVNIITRSKSGPADDPVVPDWFHGNGRDPPTLFRNDCKTPGCQFTSPVLFTMRSHETTCSVEKVERKNAVDCSFPCTVDDCASTSTTAKRLAAHVKLIHNYTAHCCKENDCEDHTLYKSSAEYRQHLRVAHHLWLPRKCPVEDCALTTEFISQNGLKVHLALGHEIKDKLVLKAYCNRRVRTFLVNQRCSYHSCTHSTSFKQKKTLLHHLRKSHQVLEEDLESYIQRVED